MKKILVIAPNDLQLAGVLNRLYEAGFDSLGARSLSEAQRYSTDFVADAVLISAFATETEAEVRAVLATERPVVRLDKNIDAVVDIARKFSV